MKKKVISIILCSIMLVALIPSTAFADTLITEVNIISDMPQVGDTDANEALNLRVPAGANYTVALNFAYLFDPGAGYPRVKADNPFLAGKKYYVRFIVTPNEGYYFDDATTFTLNGTSTGSYGGGGAQAFREGLITMPGVTYYSLNTSVNGTGGTISQGKENVADGTRETITFTPDEGYEIYSVMVNGVNKTHNVSSNQLTLTITNTTNVVVTYRSNAKYTLTTSVKNGNGSISSGDVSCDPGSTKQVTFTPNSGYKIGAITVNGQAVSIANPLSVTMNENKNVVVTYIPDDPKYIQFANATMDMPSPGDHDITFHAPSGANYTVELESAYYGNLSEGLTYVTEDNPFEAGREYTLRVVFTPKNGYYYDVNSIFKLNDDAQSSSFGGPGGWGGRYFMLTIPETTSTTKTVTSVNVQYPEPMVGKHPASASEMTLNVSPSNAGITIDSVSWYKIVGTSKTQINSLYTFRSGERYAVKINLNVPTDVTFADYSIGMVNGNPNLSTVLGSDNTLANGCLVYEYASVLEGVTISGNITKYGDSSKDVTIQLFKDDSTTPAYTVTSTSTSYALNGVAPGTYTMKVSKADCVTREYAITVGTVDLTQNVLITVMGDVNMDGQIKSTDALMVQRNSIGSQTLDSYQMKLANPDNNSNINTTDALWIQRKSIGL